LYSSRRRHTRYSRDWSSDVCSYDLVAEVLGQLQALALVVGAALAVEAGRALGHRLIDQPGDGLAVLEQEGRVVGAHLEHPARALAVGLVGPETGVEKAGVVDAELADRRIDRGHLGRLHDRDLDRLAGG